MRTFGINFDTGFTSGGTTTREPFEAATVRREMEIIRNELRCDAVRITGGDRDRLETAAHLAAEAGLSVWYCPFTNGLTQEELLDFLVDSAGRAEKLRRAGAEVVFLTGSEISVFTAGFLPGGTFHERAAVLGDPRRVRAALAAVPALVNACLRKVTAAVRAEFAGRIGYASLPFEGVDWTLFDIVATDAGYRDAQNAAGLAGGLQALTGHGKPAAVTEFGCGTFRGAAAVASRGDAVIDWDEQRARPAGFNQPVLRDEEEQAGYLRELLDIYAHSGVDAAFVYTFARYDLVHNENQDDRDFDKSSFGIVKVLTDGRTGTAYPGLPWEPKAAFHTLAAYGRSRAAGADSSSSSPR